MKLLTKVGLAAAIVVAGAGATVIYAQPNSGGPNSPAMIQARVHAQSLHTAMQEDSQHIMRLQSQARREKDVIKLNCVNDKLVQVKPLINIADAAASRIDADPSAALSAIAQSSEGVRRLREQSDQCIGEPTLGAESSNSFTSPGGYNPTQTNPWGNPVEPPAYASPYN